MKILSHLLLLLALVAAVQGAAPSAKRTAGTDDAIAAAVRAADDERIAATVAGDRARLGAVYSDELRYCHSNGRVDTKASQIEGLVAGPNRYEAFEYKDRAFKPIAPGVVLMTGRVLMHMANKGTGQKSSLDLNFLAVWREESGRWRFVAWQSCRNVPTGAPK